MTKKRKTFKVEGVITAWIELEVVADSLEQAVEEGRKLGASDFYETGGEVIDDSLKFVGVRGEVPEI